MWRWLRSVDRRLWKGDLRRGPWSEVFEVYAVGIKLRDGGEVFLLTSGSLAKEAVENQEDNGSKSGDNDAPEVE